MSHPPRTGRPGPAPTAAPHRPAAPRHPPTGRLTALAGIVLAALTLRAAVTAITPLLGTVGAALGFGPLAAGTLGMLPTAMFALFGLATPPLVARFGLERVALGAMLVTGAGTLARAAASSTAALLLLSAVPLAAMGVGNVVLPPLVKRHFPDRVGALSAVYIACVQLGTTIPPLTAVPVAQAHGWRVSVGMWALLAFAAAVPWLLPSVRRVPPAGGGAVSGGSEGAFTAPVRRSPLAWSLAVMIGTTSLSTYALFTWLPRILADAGASAGFGGAMVALFSAIGIVSALVAPVLCTRLRNPFPVVVVCVLCYLAGYTGLYLAPATVPVLWVFLVGVGPTTFAMSLTLIGVRTRTARGAARLSGFVQGVGYTLACLGPLLFGLLHDATGGWGAPFGLLLAALALMTAGAFRACRPGTLEDDLARSGKG
ncbi:MFS transporter [Streptomyces kebangsaanensis]|uniref:MFS transporter n=1 Tax=Streptomyces kebangsaanensis TaxID=864058 RepID=A0ABW6L5E6_9ACTN